VANMVDYIKKFQEESPNLWHNFEQCTKEIHPNRDLINSIFVKIDKYVASNLGVELPPSYMVFFMLVHLKKFPYEYQPIEKVLWEVHFKYQGIPFYFTERKFGFRLMAGTEDDKVIIALLKRISSAVKIVDRMIGPLLKEIVNKGDITFQNQIVFLTDRYKYFKNKASSLYDKSKNIESSSNGSIIQHWQIVKECFYYTQAMLDAYFSYQEHLLVLLLPFCDIDKEKDSVSEFIYKDWSEKFNKVFNPNKDPEMMRHYDNLREIKEKLRNKYAHGGFEKKNGSLYAKVDGLGFIPVHMNRSNGFSLVSDLEFNFTEICRVIDEFEIYLSRSNNWSRPIKIIQSGLDIYFDEYHKEEYKEAIKSDEKLEEYIEYQLYLEDRYANMDW
jgi:hypothetical protein